MRWPWQQVVLPNRPTITLMDDDLVIVGLPSEVTQAQAEAISEQLRRWSADPKRMLVLPFPVEVIDKRTRREPVYLPTPEQAREDAAFAHTAAAIREFSKHHPTWRWER